MAVIIIILVAFVLFFIYVLLTCGRAGNSQVSKLLGIAYAHRGLHSDIVPENSMEAFQLAKVHGYGVELDVHLLKDDSLAVFHDTSLDRMTGRSGRIVDLTSGELVDYKLRNTEYHIPLLNDVLTLFNGEVPLIVELKSVDSNYATLCKCACELLDKYTGIYCIESFDPRCIYWLKKHRPELIRGQLSQNFIKSSKSKMPWLLKFVMANHLLNFLTRPDFVAYRFSDRKTLSNWFCRRFWKLQMVGWTIHTQEAYEQAISEGWIPIFENFTP